MAAIIFVLQFLSFSIILCLFLSIPLVAIGEDFILQMSVIFLLSDQLPCSSHMYSPYLLISHWTYYSSADSLILVSSLCSFLQQSTFSVSITFSHVLFFFFFIFLLLVCVHWSHVQWLKKLSTCLIILHQIHYSTLTPNAHLNI